MIETFEGRLGGGKSYTAMQRIIRVLCAGGFVATNMKLMIEPWVDKKFGSQRGLREILRLRGWTLRDDQIITLPDYEYVDFTSRQDGKHFRLSKLQAFWTLIPRVSDGVILVVIDEAHFHFPQSGYRAIPPDVVEFLTLSRHACVDIIFISQHIKNMWCQMSRLAQYRWEFRDLKKYGMYFAGKFPIPSMTLPWPFRQILQSQYDYDGKTLISKKFDWHDSVIHECYTSPDLINAFASSGEVKTIKYEAARGLSVKQKIIITLSGALAASLVWAVVYFKNPRIEIVTVERVVTNVVSRASAFVESDPVFKEIEYCTGVVRGGGIDRLLTNKRTYKRGGVLEDGSIISEILDNGYVVASGSGFSTITFPSSSNVVHGVAKPSRPAAIGKGFLSLSKNGENS